MEAKRFIKLILLKVVILGLVCVDAISPANVYDLHKNLVTNYPNPFDSRHESTQIICKVSYEANTKMMIYDLFGNLVREYPSERMMSGIKRIRWDGTNESGQKVAKGGYICVVEITNDSNRILATRKIGVIH
ncbi:MAG: hypothetical protein JW871_00130 [Endomicrobiales bacterium]|nr:hypothetical protein [Endomicrobiales bacterium]